MESGFRRIFWGVLFIFVEVTIGSVDILPNFLGAYFIYSGCKKLKEIEESFNRVINTTKLFIGLEVINSLVILLVPFTNDSQMLQSMIMTVGNLLLGIVELYIIYHICQGIYNIAAGNDFSFIMDKSNFRWKFKCYSFLLVQMLIPFSYNVEHLFITVPITILTIAEFVAYILILFLINTAKKELIELKKSSL
jgi:hypothetical protein